MTMQYPIGKSLRQMGALLKVTPEQVLARAGLPTHRGQDEDFTVDSELFFRVWDALYIEGFQQGMEVELARSFAHGPFLPSVFAFSCADTLSLGLERFAKLKPLAGPININLSRDHGHLRLELHSADPILSVPPSLGCFELFYIMECTRTFTSAHIKPEAWSLPAGTSTDETHTAFMGSLPNVSDGFSLTFSGQDADRDLTTRSPSLWEALEPKFFEQLKAQLGTATMSGKIKQVLVEALPGGATSVEHVARRLRVSKRSLQRRLNEEGTSYQHLLNETRFEMSERYLKKSSLSLPEISYLLGFRDTSSFFRAFQGWAGMTPGAFRATSNPLMENRGQHEAQPI